MKRINLLVLGIVIILLTASCSRNTVPTKAPEIPVYLQPFHIVGKSTAYIKSLQYFNSSQFTVTTIIKKSSDMIENGIKNSMDSSYPITYTIPQGKKCRALDVLYAEDGSPDTLYLSFDTTNTNLRFWFYFDYQYSGYRIQEPEDKIITRNGNEFELNSKPPPDRCKLYFKEASTSGTQPINIIASGDEVNKTLKDPEKKKKDKEKPPSNEKN